MAAKGNCPTCGAFLNQMGVCLACHPVGRTRNDGKGKNPWHGNTKKKK